MKHLKSLQLAFLIFSGLGLNAQNSGTDYDSNLYQTVTIASQVWMQEDLKNTHYQNDDPIPDSLKYFGMIPPGDTAVLFAPGIISQADRIETQIAFSPNGKECYFDRYDSVGGGIFYCKFINGIWTEQEEAPFSINLNHEASTPFFSADGKKLYFGINEDIAYIERISGDWSELQVLPAPINSTSRDYSYSETNEGVGYFTSNRSGGINNSLDLWRVNQPNYLSSQVENLGPIINSSTEDFSSCIAPDGSYLIFASYRSSRFSEQSLWISFNKEDNSWTKPVDMEISGAKINIPNYWQINPTISPDGKFLFFCHHAASRDSIHIFWVSTNIIDGLKKYAYAPKYKRQIPNMNIEINSTINYTIPNNTFSCEYGVETLKFKATLSNGSALPSWLNFNPETKTLSGTPTQLGIDTIEITATNVDTLSASCTFNINVSTATALSEIEEKKISIYPNPTSQIIQIRGEGILIKNASYQLSDSSGKVFKQGKLESESVDISELSRGVFIFSLITDEGIINKKLIIE